MGRVSFLILMNEMTENPGEIAPTGQIASILSSTAQK
jgi:hypothetical protein